MTQSMFGALDVLQNHGIPVVVIGGHAVIVHGHVRATQDIDVVFARTPEAEVLLTRALQEIGAFWIGDEIDPASGIEKTFPVDLAFVKSRRLMMLGSNFGYLDLFDYVPGLPDASVAELFHDAIWVAGRRFASLAWLRRMKQASGRPQDLIDLENLPLV
jgi:hypothetical protein